MAPKFRLAIRGGVALSCALVVLQIEVRSRSCAFPFCNRSRHKKRPQLWEDVLCWGSQSFAESANAFVVRLVVVVLVAIVEVQFPRISGRVLRGRPVVVSNKRKADSCTWRNRMLRRGIGFRLLVPRNGSAPK